MRFLVIKSKAKLGSTMIVVKTKKIAQLPPSPSTIKPLAAAKVVRERLPMDANAAYCVAVYARSHNCERKATKATVDTAVVNWSATTATANNSLLGQMASAAKKRLVAAMAITAQEKPFQ